MNIRPMSKQEVAKHHFVPQAVLKQPPSYFMSKGVSFCEGEDDLDKFEIAELSLEGEVPFALVRYRGTPDDETTVFLPSRFDVSEVPSLIRLIIFAFGLPAAAVSWQRTRSDTPY